MKGTGCNCCVHTKRQNLTHDPAASETTPVPPTRLNLRLPLVSVQHGKSCMRCLLLYKHLECLVTGENGCSVIKRFHALTQTASRASQCREMCMHDCGCSRIDAKCNALSELGGDGNLVENGRGPFQGNSWHHFVRNRILSKNTRPPVIVCLKGGDRLGYQLRLGSFGSLCRLSS